MNVYDLSCVCMTEMQQNPTFVYRDDVWVAEGRHDLNLSPYVNHVLLILDLLLPNRLDSHLETKKYTLIGLLTAT